uniref:EGF-like domain-containing protein n=1 Tax=Steinernema glaseri TaxID=37863 RepID=A0A1I7YQG3_9BILA
MEGINRKGTRYVATRFPLVSGSKEEGGQREHCQFVFKYSLGMASESIVLVDCVVPCENGGMCLKVSGIRTCWCPKGFSGAFCQWRDDFLCERETNNLLWIGFYVQWIGVAAWSLYVIALTINLLYRCLSGTRKNKKETPKDQAEQPPVQISEPFNEQTLGNAPVLQ